MCEYNSGVGVNLHGMDSVGGTLPPSPSSLHNLRRCPLPPSLPTFSPSILPNSVPLPPFLPAQSQTVSPEAAEEALQLRSKAVVLQQELDRHQALSQQLSQQLQVGRTGGCGVRGSWCAESATAG